MSPQVTFNSAKGELLIEGRAIPEDPGMFFEPLSAWLKEYFKAPQKKTVVDIKLEYINSGSSKFILELFKIIKDNYLAGKDVLVNWHYEEDDESLLELGEHYKNSFDFPFNLVEFI
ncbi:MAG: DUF1987 domain-containing protein [Bacteroidales bacterium]|nr:DUF1987 domain-containing protein [Bacteroidales bacterium]